MFNYKSLIGINTVHIDVKTIYEMGFSRFEICLGHGMPYHERIEQIHQEMLCAEQYGLQYSIHHPIYLFDWFPYNYLDAFFLDPDVEKRDVSMRLLEENLKLLQKTKTSYVVLHFPGVYLENYMEADAFEALLEETLVKLDNLAVRYDMDLLLEYFGSNVMFASPSQWIEKIKNRKRLSLLTDTGHLYFASRLRGFDYEEALVSLACHSKAFHLWTTKGLQPYADNDYYKKYHHIMASAHQKTSDGWAFDTSRVLDHMLKHRYPIIIEASPSYGGTEYFMQGIEQIRDHAEQYNP